MATIYFPRCPILSETFQIDRSCSGYQLLETIGGEDALVLGSCSPVSHMHLVCHCEDRILNHMDRWPDPIGSSFVLLFKQKSFH